MWTERLKSRHHDAALLWGGFLDGELAAAAYGRLPRSPWQPTDAGWVGLVAVAPSAQGRGLGTRVLAHLLHALAARGAGVVSFGAEADHLLPGPPQECGPALWRLLRRFGARFTGVDHDLHLDLRPELPPTPVAAGWRLRTDDPDGANAFVAAAFPGRWAEETADYLSAGAAVVTLERLASAAGPATVQGFCVAFTGQEATTSPGLIWLPALQRDLAASGLSDVKVAAIGPLGVAPEVRGSGLGLALVRGAAAHLQRAGATDLIINWTTLSGFYGRLGARVWRSYQRSEARLPAAAELAALASGGGPPGETSGGAR